jgi:phosphoglycolate phosphatase
MTTNSQFDAIFDFDGVLADSAPLIVEILERLLCHDLGLQISTEQLRATVGPPFRQAVEELCSLTKTSLDAPHIDEIVQAFRAEYAMRVVSETPMFAGTSDALSVMHEDFRLTICSSKPRPLIDAMLVSWCIGDLFAAVEAPPLGSTETKTEGLARLLSDLDMRTDNCALIGDTVYDAAAANANGVRLVAVSWGIGDPDELLAAGAVNVVNHPSELAATIAGLNT